MNLRRVAVASFVCLALAGHVSAHRLDEYLQATIFSVEQNRISAEMRLIPGVAVAARVLAAIDANADGVISASEQRSYAESVLGDLKLSIDGQSLRGARYERGISQG